MCNLLLLLQGLELVENHIEKALSKDLKTEIETKMEMEIKSDVLDVKMEVCEESNAEEVKPQAMKRPAADDIVESECKKPHLSITSNLNGNIGADSPAPESVTSSNGDEGVATVSTAAAKLFADIAADILEDEEEELMQQQQVSIFTFCKQNFLTFMQLS